jgi:hypothetical protein
MDQTTGYPFIFGVSDGILVTSSSIVFLVVLTKVVEALGGCTANDGRQARGMFSAFIN